MGMLTRVCLLMIQKAQGWYFGYVALLSFFAAMCAAALTSELPAGVSAVLVIL